MVAIGAPEIAPSLAASDTEEPDSLELNAEPLSTGANQSHSTDVDCVAVESGRQGSDDVLTLLRFERLAQKATRRDLESLQKQYDR